MGEWVAGRGVVEFIDALGVGPVAVKNAGDHIDSTSVDDVEKKTSNNQRQV